MFENEKIKAVRTRLNLTQQEVADTLGVSKQYLSKVENNLTELSKEKIVLFCNSYGVSFDWMFLSEGAMLKKDEEYLIHVLFTSKFDRENFKKLIIIYNMYITVIKEFIENRYPDATFDNKLKTAHEIFLNKLFRRYVSMDPQESENYLRNALKEENTQKQILDMYYEICKGKEVDA